MIKILPDNLPKDLTSYDLLKSLAVILMIIDHIGLFFYPDEMWFRVIGRLCVPIWFFLIGYAKNSKITKDLWIGGVIVAASAIVAGQYLLPLNILFSIIFLRYFRYITAVRCFDSVYGLRGMYLILLFMTLPSAILFEYGTIAMLFVLIGYMLRNWDEVQKNIDAKYLRIFAAISFFSFFINQGLLFPFLSINQALVMFVGFCIIGYIIWNFKPVTYIDTGKNIYFLLKLMGRRSLEIYVIHIVIFRAIAMYLYPDKYEFLQWDYVPANLVSMFV